MDMDRRTFLKGLLGTAAVAAVAVPVVAEAASVALPKSVSISSKVDWDLIKEVERRATQDIMQAEDERVFALLDEMQVTVDKTAMQPGDRIIISNADNAADNGVYEVTSNNGGDVTIERPVDEFTIRADQFNAIMRDVYEGHEGRLQDSGVAAQKIAEHLGLSPPMSQGAATPWAQALRGPSP
jgi:hypothetical protein